MARMSRMWQAFSSTYQHVAEPENLLSKCLPSSGVSQDTFVTDFCLECLFYTLDTGVIKGKIISQVNNNKIDVSAKEHLAPGGYPNAMCNHNRLT